MSMHEAGWPSLPTLRISASATPPRSVAIPLSRSPLRSRSYLITEQIEAVKSLKLQSAAAAAAVTATERRPARRVTVLLSQVVYYPAVHRISSRSQFLKTLNSV